MLGLGTKCHQWFSVKDICSHLLSRVQPGRVQQRSWPDCSLKGKKIAQETYTIKCWLAGWKTI